MNIIRKNVVLTPENYDGAPNLKGIVTFNIDKSSVNGFLRCYNLTKNKNLLLGVSAGGNLFKFNIPENQTCFAFTFNKNLSKDDKISCVLVEITDNTPNTLLIGSTETTSIYSQEILDFLCPPQEAEPTQTNNFDNNQAKNSNLEQIFSQNNEEYPTKTNSVENLSGKQIDLNENLNDTEIENYIDDLTAPDTCDHCKNCMYKKYFYCENKQEENFKINSNSSSTLEKSTLLSLQNESSILSADNEKQQEPMLPKEDFKITESIKKSHAFYDSLQGQFNTLLNKNPHDSVLEDILPNSKFVKIDKADGSHYVLGIVYDENGEPLYLCYGVPAKNKDDTPFNLDNFYSFLPIDVDAPQGEGYFMTYQNADTGENVKVTLI